MTRLLAPVRLRPGALYDYTASTSYDYTEQGHSNSMSNPGASGTPGDSVARPAMGYILRLLCIIMFMFKYELFMNTCTCYVSLTVFMILVNHLFNLGIKIYRNKPKDLTIQKPYYVVRLSVSQFAASIKPFVFDGSNYKRWC